MRRPIRPRDVFTVFTPDDKEHFAVAVRQHGAALIIATGTTKHLDESFFAELDGAASPETGLRERTRFLERFVYAYSYSGSPVEVRGSVIAGQFMPFLRAIDDLLRKHAAGEPLQMLPVGSFLHRKDVDKLAASIPAK
jgi:hypothetical protein